MKLIEMGEIGTCFGEDLFAELCDRIECGGGWYSYGISDMVKSALVEICGSKLPERGFTIEATKDEIIGLKFNPFEGEITIVPKDGKEQQ